MNSKSNSLPGAFSIRNSFAKANNNNNNNDEDEYDNIIDHDTDNNYIEHDRDGCAITVINGDGTSVINADVLPIVLAAIRPKQERLGVGVRIGTTSVGGTTTTADNGGAAIDEATTAALTPPNSNNNNSNNNNKRRTRLLAAATAIVVLVVAVSVSTPLLLNQKNNSGDNNNNDNDNDNNDSNPGDNKGLTQEESDLETTTSVVPLQLEKIVEGGREALDPESPNASFDRIDALTIAWTTAFWVINMKQFVLVLLYFATQGEGWCRQHSFLSDLTPSFARQTTGACLWNSAEDSKNNNNSNSNSSNNNNETNYDCHSNDETDSAVDDVFEGIECDDEGRVVRIVLPWNNLRGTIPPELSYFADSLVQLNLGGGALTGTIPSSLEQLTKLEILALNDNCLTGTIPAGIALLPNLSVLSLYHNSGLVGSLNYGNICDVGVDNVDGVGGDGGDGAAAAVALVVAGSGDCPDKVGRSSNSIDNIECDCCVCCSDATTTATATTTDLSIITGNGNGNSHGTNCIDPHWVPPSSGRRSRSECW